MRKFVLPVLLACSISGCVTTQVAPIARQDLQEPEVFITRLPAQPYEELSFIETSGAIYHSRKKLLAKMKEKARSEKADALIQVQFGYVFWWPYASGVSIRYRASQALPGTGK